MTHKVIYHIGETIAIRTKPANGRLSLEISRLTITGNPTVNIPLRDVLTC